MSRSAGWYPDPNDAESEIYWDGSSWHGRRQKHPSTMQPHPVARASKPSAEGVIPFTERAAEFWHGLSDRGRAAIIIGVIVVAALIGLLIAHPWQSKFQQECESKVMDDGVSPTSPSFEGYVNMCVKNSEEFEKFIDQ